MTRFPYAKFLSVLVGVCFAFAAAGHEGHSHDHDEVLSTEDSPSFETTNDLWGPQSGIITKSFREDIINIQPESGTLGEVWGGDLDLDTAEHVGDATFLCPSGEVFFVDGCYEQCPSGAVQIGNVCIETNSGEDKGPYGCFEGERDNLLGECYACPSGFSRDVLGICRDDANPNNHGGATFTYDCPSGYSNVGVTCVKTSCPSGYSHTPWTIPLGGDCSKTYTHRHESEECDGWAIGGWCLSWSTVFGDSHSHTSYKWTTTTTKQPDITIACDWGAGHWLYGESCYSCPSGYSNDLVGGCTKTTDDVYAHDFWCPADQTENLVTGRCYQCEDGFHDNLLGECSRETIASREGDPTMLCPSGQFPSSPFEDFDWTDPSLSPPECYRCEGDYHHNPLLGVNTLGVCFDLDFEPNLQNAPFELGMQIDYSYHFKWGMDGGITVDPGSVNIEFDPRVNISLERPPEAPGPELITLKTEQLAGDSSLSMTTTWPAVDMHIDTYLDAASSMSGRVSYTEVTPDSIASQEFQREETFDIFSQSTGGEQRLDPDPLAEVHIGADGFGLRVIGDPVIDFDGGFDPPIQVAWPIAETPGGFVNLGYVVAELGLVTPDMATPAESGYDGIHGSEVQLTSGPGTYAHSFIRPGPRAGIDYGILTTGAQDPDVGRFDLDLDGVYAVASNQPLGFKVQMPLTKIPPINIWDISASSVDVDGGMIFSFDETFHFEPRLNVTLNFSKEVEAETSPGSGVYTKVSSIVVTVGEDLKFFHPGGELHIATEYNLDDNMFINDTDLVLTPLIEGQYMAFNYNILGMPSDMPNHFAALQVTQDLSAEPVKIADINYFDDETDARFALTGFGQQSGGTLYVIGRNQPPVAVCQDTSVDLDGVGEVSLVADQVDGGSYDPDDGDSLVYALDRYHLSCADLGPTSLELTATDLSGESDSCTAVVDVLDVDAPSLAITDPGPVEATGPDGANVNIETTSEDNCDTLVATEYVGNLFKLGITDVIYTATDSSGNETSKSIGIEVVDTTPPVVAAPPNISVEATHVITPIALTGAGAVDIVDGEVTPVPSTSEFPYGDTLVTWSATDQRGNTGTANQLVTITDNTPPVLTLPANVQVEATGPQTPVSIGTATATDIFNVTVSSDSTGSFPLGTTVVTWTATDEHGNSSTGLQEVTVVDTTAPVVNAPPDVTVVATGLLTEVDLGSATATDAVGVTTGPDHTPASPYYAGTTEITWSAGDSSGNTGTDTQQVIVLGQLSCDLSTKGGGDDDDDDEKSGKQSLSVFSHNADPNQGAIWETLFGQLPGGKKLATPVEHTLIFPEGELSLTGDFSYSIKEKGKRGNRRLELEVKAQVRGSGDDDDDDDDDDRKGKGKNGSTPLILVAASGGLDPLMPGGGSRDVEADNLAGVSLSLGGSSFSGTLDSLKLKLDKQGQPSSVKLKLILDGDASEVKKASADSLVVEAPATSFSVLAGTAFKEKKDRKANLVIASLGGSDKSDKSKKSGKSDKSDKSKKSGKSDKSDKSKKSGKSSKNSKSKNKYVSPISILDVPADARSGSCVIQVDNQY